MLSIQEIMEIIPHRPPFLLIDRILELDERHAIGIKQVTINEPFFVGHFPGNPLMPGVLQIEALAQVGAVAVLHQPAYRGKLAVFARIENVRFRKPVVPGDTLELEVQLVELRGKDRQGSWCRTCRANGRVRGRFYLRAGRSSTPGACRGAGRAVGPDRLTCGLRS